MREEETASALGATVHNIVPEKEGKRKKENGRESGGQVDYKKSTVDRWIDPDCIASLRPSKSIAASQEMSARQAHMRSAYHPTQIRMLLSSFFLLFYKPIVWGCFLLD